MEKKVRYYKPRTGESGELILIGLPEGVTAEELAAAVGAVEGEIPENVSQLTNDAGYVDAAGAAAAAPVQSVDGKTGTVRTVEVCSSIADLVAAANAHGASVPFVFHTPAAVSATLSGTSATGMGIAKLVQAGGRIDYLLSQSVYGYVTAGYIDSATATVTDSWRLARANEVFYEAGSAFTVDGGALTGFVTTSAKRLYVEVPVRGSMANVNTVTLETMKGGCRTTAGAYLDGGSDTTDWLNNSAYTITVTKAGVNLVTIKIDKSTAFTNVTTNTPVTFWANELKLRFSNT